MFVLEGEVVVCGRRLRKEEEEKEVLGRQNLRIRDSPLRFSAFPIPDKQGQCGWG